MANLINYDNKLELDLLNGWEKEGEHEWMALRGLKICECDLKEANLDS